jgi:hypothetical protein
METPESVTPETTPQVQSPVVTPQQGTDWEKRYKGLQAVYDKALAANKQLEAQIAQLNADLEAERQSARSHDESRTAQEKRIAELGDQITVVRTALQVEQARSTRSAFIAKEFPDLLGFEAQGLLPTAKDDDELKTKLELFRSQVTGRKTADLQNYAQGSVPSVPGSTQGRTKDTIYAELM